MGSEMEQIQPLICWLDVVLEDEEITSVHCLFWKKKKEVMKHNIPLCSCSREKGHLTTGRARTSNVLQIQFRSTVHQVRNLAHHNKVFFFSFLNC